MAVPALRPAILASDFEREEVSDRLREGLADGRLSFDEFRERTAHLMVARTHPDLARLVADLPRPAVEDDSAAVVSLVSGILAWTCIPFLAALVAVVSGHMSRRRKPGRGRRARRGMAMAGLIMGYANLGAWVLAGTALLLVGLLTHGFSG